MFKCTLSSSDSMIVSSIASSVIIKERYLKDQRNDIFAKVMSVLGLPLVEPITDMISRKYNIENFYFKDFDLRITNRNGKPSFTWIRDSEEYIEYSFGDFTWLEPVKTNQRWDIIGNSLKILATHYEAK